MSLLVGVGDFGAGALLQQAADLLAKAEALKDNLEDIAAGLPGGGAGGNTGGCTPIDNAALQAAILTITQKATEVVAAAGATALLASAAHQSKLDILDLIPQGFTPTGGADTRGASGSMAYDNLYLYIRNAEGWRRLPLQSF